MPSGHTETITIISLLLYHIKIISLPIALLFIFIIGLQRIITNMHTPLQVLIGFIFGLFYTFLYIKCELSYKCFIYLGLITIIFIMFIFYKTELLVNETIPLWVDKSMIRSINKKRNVPLYSKLFSLSNNDLYINWNSLEKYLDLIIYKIKS